eukprot:6042250-Pleurochrysis_carterae.AAC.1
MSPRSRLRCQVTAAAAAKGMLELEGELPPIQVSLVRKDSDANQMLDDTSAIADLAQARARRTPHARTHAAARGH